MVPRPSEITDTKNTLHSVTYSDICDELSLQSSLVQSARNLAATALGNCKNRIIKDGERASKPTFRGSVACTTGPSHAATTTYPFPH